MADQVSGKRKPNEEIGLSTPREKVIQNSTAIVYLSSEEVTLSDKKSEVSSVYKSSEEYYECDPCTTVGDHAEAEGFCTDCNEYLCSSHSRNRLSKHHVLMSKDDCNPCKFAGDETKAVGYCKYWFDRLCSCCFKDHPLHIAVSHDESVIYVSDWCTNKVISLDINGNMLSLYQGKLERPQGIIISPSGSVYVCNRRRHIVYKMTSDLSEAMVMLVQGDGLNFPHAICLNEINQHLYISSGSSEAKYKNILKVYKC